MSAPRKSISISIACVVVSSALVVLAVQADSTGDLPAAVRSAVESAFPGARIVATGQEREQGVLYYEVELRDGDDSFEVEVTAEGAIGEVEREIDPEDLPAAVRNGLAEIAGGAELKEVERIEVRGVPHGDSFRSVDPPLVVYEVVYESGGVWREIVVDSEGQRLAGEQDDDDESDEDEDGDESDDSHASSGDL